MLGMTSVTLVRNSAGCSLVTRLSPVAGLVTQHMRNYFQLSLYVICYICRHVLVLGLLATTKYIIPLST